MGKSTKFRKHYKSKKAKNRKFAKGKEIKTETKVLDLPYSDYVDKIKESKKYLESIEYLKNFHTSLEDKSVVWKFKSNLQTFIKKYILIKDIFNSKSFSDFQFYFAKMAGKEQFIKTCEEIVRKITDDDRKIVYDVLAFKIKPLDEDEYDKLAEKIKKRCVILIETSSS